MVQPSATAEISRHDVVRRSERRTTVGAVAIIVVGAAITATIVSLYISSGGSWVVFLLAWAAATVGVALVLGVAYLVVRALPARERPEPRQSSPAARAHRSGQVMPPGVETVAQTPVHTSRGLRRKLGAGATTSWNVFAGLYNLVLGAIFLFAGLALLFAIGPGPEGMAARLGGGLLGIGYGLWLLAGAFGMRRRRGQR